MVAGVGFEPTTSGRADEIGRQENDSPIFVAHGLRELSREGGNGCGGRI